MRITPRPTGFSEKGLDPDVDLLVQDIIGIRTFRVADDGTLLPVVPGIETSWKSGLNKAICVTHVDYGPNPSPHIPPEADCTCGFYSYTYLPEVSASAYRESVHVLAAVKNEGKLRYGNRGICAQYARLEAIWFSKEVPTSVADKVLRRYPELEENCYRDRALFLNEHPPQAPGENLPRRGYGTSSPVTVAINAFTRGCARLVVWSTPVLLGLLLLLSLIKERAIEQVPGWADPFIAWTRDDLGRSNSTLLTVVMLVFVVIAGVSVVAALAEQSARTATTVRRHCEDLIHGPGTLVVVVLAINIYEETSLGTLRTAGLILFAAYMAKRFAGNSGSVTSRGSGFTPVKRTGALRDLDPQGWSHEGTYPLWRFYLGPVNTLKGMDSASVSVLRQRNTLLLFVQEVYEAMGEAVLSPETNGWFERHLTGVDQSFVVVSGTDEDRMMLVPLTENGTTDPRKRLAIPSRETVQQDDAPVFLDRDEAEQTVTLPPGVWVPPTLRIDVPTTLDAITGDSPVCVRFAAPQMPTGAEEVTVARADGDAWLHQRWYRECQEKLASTRWKTNIYPEVPTGKRLPAEDVVQAWAAIFEEPPEQSALSEDERDGLAQYYVNITDSLPPEARCEISTGGEVLRRSRAADTRQFGHRVLVAVTLREYGHAGLAQPRITENGKVAVTGDFETLMVLEKSPGDRHMGTREDED